MWVVSTAPSTDVRLFSFRRPARHGLPSSISSTIHKFLLRLATIPRFLRRYGNEMPSVALLRHRRSSGDFPVSQRHPVLASRICLRLVVQRAMRTQPGSICNQQSPIRHTQRRPHTTAQIYHKRTFTKHICMNACITRVGNVVYMRSYRQETRG